jgi:hypothetical protein
VDAGEKGWKPCRAARAVGASRRGITRGSSTSMGTGVGSDIREDVPSGIVLDDDAEGSKDVADVEVDVKDEVESEASRSFDRADMYSKTDLGNGGGFISPKRSPRCDEYPKSV